MEYDGGSPGARKLVAGVGVEDALEEIHAARVAAHDGAGPRVHAFFLHRNRPILSMERVLPWTRQNPAKWSSALEIQLLKLLELESARGIANLDLSVNNLAFLGDRVVAIDRDPGFLARGQQPCRARAVNALMLALYMALHFENWRLGGDFLRAAGFDAQSMPYKRLDDDEVFVRHISHYVGNWRRWRDDTELRRGKDLVMRGKASPEKIVETLLNLFAFDGNTTTTTPATLPPVVGRQAPSGGWFPEDIWGEDDVWESMVFGRRRVV